MNDHSPDDYYRACAAEMMAKAQSAPSKAVRQAYLNLVLNWAQQAASAGDSGLITDNRPDPAKKN
jgi:hypothetical protein